MPEIKSYADLIRDWEKLLTSATERQDQLPNIEAFRQPVEQVLAEAKAIKSRQDAAAGDRQRATQELTELITRGRDLVARMRQAVRAQVGLKNEILILFGVKPVRRRVRRTTRRTDHPEPAGPHADGPCRLHHTVVSHTPGRARGHAPPFPLLPHTLRQCVVESTAWTAPFETRTNGSSRLSKL